jgi:hypothetical protein
MAAKTKKPAAKKAAAPSDMVEFFDMPQRSPEWFAMRMGIPTASQFSSIVANGKDGGESLTRAKLMRQYAGEILTGRPAETYQSAAMRRGIEMEPLARDYYARRYLTDVDPIGFVRRTVRNPLGDEWMVGCSPDGLIGDDDVLQIKTMEAEAIIALAQKGAAGFPSEHRAQCQGELWVLGRRRNHLLLYADGDPPIGLRFTIERSDDYINKELKPAVEVFSYDLRMLVDKLRKSGLGR